VVKHFHVADPDPESDKATEPDQAMDPERFQKPDPVKNRPYQQQW
jgi:hypothetical protein